MCYVFDEIFAMFEWIANPEAWAALATLTALEIVLGIDNIIFLSILVARLPEQQRAPGRTLGLALAMLTRLALLFFLSRVMGLTDPFMSPFGYDVSGRDLILIGGGLFLLYKATTEIHHSVEGAVAEPKITSGSSNFFIVLAQIAILDIVFSLDSVITAVGLVDHLSIMVIAIIIAVCVMMFAAKSIGEFVESHPTIKVLALSFLVIVGLTLIMEGFEVHVPKGYIYFAMTFSLAVEMINIRMRKKMTDK